MLQLLYECPQDKLKLINSASVILSISLHNDISYISVGQIGFSPMEASIVFIYLLSFNYFALEKNRGLENVPVTIGLKVQSG